MSEKYDIEVKEHAASESEDYAKATEIAIRKYELSKHKKRPTIRDYIPRIFDDFIELHGDRGYADDKAILCGIARFKGLPVTVIGQVKGHNTNENIESNFGMAKPEGYRKALRQMKLAEKFSRPIITFVDTPGAYPGIESEERGQGEAIARNLIGMSRLKTPILTVITGEGYSGGALGIAQSNCVLMLENAAYAIISAKGFISILWKDPNNRKDPEKEKEAAARLKMTATDLLGFGIIDGIIPEPPEGAHKDHDITAASIKTSIEINLAPLLKMSPEEVYMHRYNKFRNMGIFSEI